MSKRRIDRELVSAAVLFAALGDETRLALVRLCADGPASISALADRFQLTRQGVTKHLEVLADAGVLASRREGRERIWDLRPERLVEAREQLEQIARGWDDALVRLKSLAESGD